MSLSRKILKILKGNLIAFPFLCFGVLSAQNSNVDFSYFDAHKSFEERTEILVNQMTLEEKISQLVNDSQEIPRLKIPKYNWWNESLHGVARAGYATVFPQSISVAASFNKNLMKEIGTAISDEARAKHHEFIREGKREIYTGLTMWSPNINIFRDPRWGRGHETYGEDPYLTGELASEYIIGLQGDDPKYFKTIATSKHFVVHSGPEALRHTFDVDVSNRDLYETYFPAFKKTIQEAKVYSVMSAYNRFRGESASGSDFLLNQILRKQWGFEGFVVSDCGAIRDIHTNHKIADSKPEAAAIGLSSGCDLECGDYYSNLIEAIDKGLISEKEIDVAVKRLFLARFKLGMFDPDEMVPFTQIPEGIVTSDVHNNLARIAAQESTILLKNKNNLLPLSKNKLKKIAVIGPNADNWESLLGNYHGTPKNPVTFLQGIQNKVEPLIEVLYAEGSHLSDKALNLKPIPSVYFQTNEGKQGLNASYFSNMTFEGKPVLEKIDDKIDFSWQHQPISKDLIDDFSVRWEGFLVPTESGKYELGVFSKRGMKLKIEETEISNGKGSVHHEKYKTGILDLVAGKKYAITVDYNSDKSDAIAQLLWTKIDEDRIGNAVKIAQESDITVLVLGLSQRLEAEGGDRENLNFPEPQEKLLKAIQATGKPVILVINAGSALDVSWAKENIDAIINVGYPGEDGGNALADVIFGDYNPAGRLPITYYKSIDELPPFEDYNMKGRTYRYFQGAPLYPFGYGLSYTNFKYSNLVVPKTVKAGEDVKISVQVTNSGTMEGDEVIQLYLKDVKASTPRPQHQLEGFERIHLKSGETKTVEFTLTPEQLSLINKNSERVIESGTFEVYVGGEQPGFQGENHASTTEVVKGQFKVNGNLKLNL